MRDPDRIGRILDKIRHEWEANPDQRFGQLIVNMGIIEIDLEPVTYKKIVRDPFYAEDDLTERKIDAYIARYNPPPR